MADLTGTTPANTYKGLLQVNDYTDGIAGNTGSNALVIQDGAGNATALAISTGNVGIGTTSPDAPLEIRRLSLGTVVEGLRLSNPGGGSNEGITINFETGNSAGFGAKIAAIREGSGGVGLNFYTGEINAGPINRMIIDHDGNVGIGTTSPAKKLHVNCGAVNEVARFESTDGTAYLSIMDSNTSNPLQGIGSLGDDLLMYVNNGERMRIDSNGNVGIGTPSPDAPLHILESGTSDMLIIESTDSGALNSPDLTLYRNSATPVADDKLGVLKFSGNDSGGGTKLYAHIEGTIVNPTNLKSKLAFNIRRDGSFESRMEVGPDKVEVSSTTGGMVMPRMTTIQRTAVSAVDGEMVYDTDLNKFFGYANGAWTALH